MKPHEIQVFKGRSGSIFATHPGLQGVYIAQTGNVYPELPITAVAIPRDSVLGSVVDSVVKGLTDLELEGNTQ